MRYPSAEDLRYFEEVAKRGSFSRAADALGLRQSTLSTAMQRVERSVGAKLFTRGKTGAHLTAAGQVLLDEARQFQRRWLDVRVKIGLAKSAIAGRYSIGCHPSAGMIVLPAVAKELAGTCPQVELEIVTTYQGTVVEQVKERKLDFGISASPNVSIDVDSIPLLPAEIGLWVKESLDASRELPLIYDPETIGFVAMLRRLQGGRHVFGRHMPVGNLELVAELARAGVGIAILPDIVARREPSRPLTPLHPKITYRTPLRFYFRTETAKTPGGSAIIETVRKTFSKGKTRV